VREQAKKINIARQKLIELLDDAIESGITDVDQLITVARKHAIENLGAFIGTTGIPGTEKLFQTNLGTPTAPYQSIVKEVRENCVIVSDNDISNARNHGERNLMTYLANLEIDAYIAMRNPLNFISNHAFMTGLFKHGQLRDWGVRFFDPTQSFLADRFQEGLAECLLMKNAEVTIYNAQESGTVYNVREFGRDAEVSVALAEGKPVIVYVPRLFSRQRKFVDFYRIIDNTVEVETFVIELMKFDLLNEEEASTLLGPEKTKADLVVLATKKLEHNLTYLAPNEIQAELITLGYEAPLNRAELITFVVQRIIQLEKRALNFREVNPLSLQASANGVAKGVIVTRSIEDTATVLRGLLLGTLEYDIVDREENWTLVDKITRSPVRVVTKNSALTTLFWNAFSEGESAQPGF